jgi:hypothetical protein
MVLRPYNIIHKFICEGRLLPSRFAITVCFYVNEVFNIVYQMLCSVLACVVV